MPRLRRLTTDTFDSMQERQSFLGFFRQAEPVLYGASGIRLEVSLWVPLGSQL